MSLIIISLRFHVYTFLLTVNYELSSFRCGSGSVRYPSAGPRSGFRRFRCRIVGRCRCPCGRSVWRSGDARDIVEQDEFQLFHGSPCSQPRCPCPFEHGRNHGLDCYRQGLAEDTGSDLAHCSGTYCAYFHRYLLFLSLFPPVVTPRWNCFPAVFSNWSFVLLPWKLESAEAHATHIVCAKMYKITFSRLNEMFMEI